VTHDPAVARRAKRVIVLKDGRVVFRGPRERIQEAVAILSTEDRP
jgi:ABC-type lipoprotein export system ATPase subunit